MKTIGFKTQDKTKQSSNSTGGLQGIALLSEENTAHNRYLEEMCKAFREFLEDEANLTPISEQRFLKKIDAIRLLFPEDRRLLKHLLIQAKRG